MNNSNSNNQSSHQPKNYAYIDSQNLNMTIQNLGWNVDWAKFREYLRTKHNVAVAYLFIGYIAENQELYSFLQKSGFVIIFKPVVIGKEGNVKGNIDAELVLQAMIDIPQYDKAVIITGDGDFHGLVNHLYSQNKLEILLVPNLRQYSSLLKTAARDKIDFISNMRRDLEYKKRPSAARTALVRGSSSTSSSPSSSTASKTTSSSRSSSGSQTRSPRRRSAQANLEDALMKAVDAGPQATTSEPANGTIVTKDQSVTVPKGSDKTAEK